jgi:hypothetical protein
VSIEQVRRQVQGPAIALLIAGMLDCLVIPMMGIMLTRGFEFREPGAPPPARSSAETLLAVAAAVGFVVATLTPGALMILSAVRMRRLQAYWLAVTASILAIVASPTCLFIGLPIGIWALAVLSQREVRAAFSRPRPPSRPRPVLKAITAIVMILSVAGLACFGFWVAMYHWQESQIPKKARLASIERRYRRQLDKLAEYAYDYDRVARNGQREDKEASRLFADPAIVEAVVYSSNLLNKGGFGVKAGGEPAVGSSCVLYRSPSIGNPVINLWTCGDRQIVEYCACVVDRDGVVRSYEIKFDPSKMAENGE